jgi:hypothetical protein
VGLLLEFPYNKETHGDIKTGRKQKIPLSQPQWKQMALRADHPAKDKEAKLCYLEEKIIKMVLILFHHSTSATTSNLN